MQCIRTSACHMQTGMLVCLNQIKQQPNRHKQIYCIYIHTHTQYMYIVNISEVRVKIY